jgi:hypothetical protein
VAANGPGNGRERLDLRVGGQSIGLSVKDLIPILLLIIAGIAGYLVYQAQDARLQRLHEHHIILFNQIERTHALIVQQNETIRRWLQTVAYNIGRDPSEQVPLELPSPLLAPKPPPGKE